MMISITSNKDSGNHGLSNNVYGDLLALFGAILYGFYITLIKKKVGNENRLNSVMFLGFVGALNIILIWPLFFVLNYFGLERFEPPESSLVWKCLLLNSFLGTTLSELLWLLSMLMTTPLIATMGLSLTIPLALVGDYIKGNTFSIQFIVGALFVIMSFISVNIADIFPDFDNQVSYVQHLQFTTVAIH